MGEPQRRQQFSAAHLDEIKSRVPLSSLIGAAVPLVRNGPEFEALCPFHAEDTPSFTVVDGKGFFHCFGCGAHGDHFDWLQERSGMKFPDAVRYLAEWSGVAPDAEVIPIAGARRPEPEWTPVLPVPSGAPPLIGADGTARVYNPKRANTGKEWTTLRPAMTHAYRSMTGDLLGYVLRCQSGDGRKFTPTITWCGNADGESRWCMIKFPSPRPLYGLERLAGRKPGNLLIVEGEKCVDRAQALLDIPVLSWPGGTGGIAHVDLSPLAGWKPMIWPDADDSGAKAAEGFWHERTGEAKPGVAQLALAAGCAGVRIVQPPEDVAKGWDVADAVDGGWDRDRLMSFMRSSLREPRTPTRPAAPPAAPEETRAPPPPATNEPPATEPPDDDRPRDEAPPHAEPSGPDAYGPEYGGHDDGPPPPVVSSHYRALGYDRNHFFFLGHRGGQVLKFAGGTLKDKGVLMTLAPLQYWEREYPSRTGVSGDMAANALISAAYKAGPYDPDRIRGRGAWWDDGKAVIHLGDKLLVNGDTAIDPPAFESRFIYERAPAFRAPAEAPLPTKEAHQLLDLCEMISWEKSLSSYLLAGWCVLAPICGALEWRPSIWLIGPSGTGKGWIIKNIIRPIVGSWAMKAIGNTSASGLEQRLKYDSRPVIFDEAEAENESAQARMQDVMFLMRVGSSADEEERQYKGTQDGSGRSSQARTCFAYASVNLPVKQLPDESRLAPLSLYKRDDPVAFAMIKEARRRIVTEDFASRLLARTIRLIPTIRANANTFAEAATELFGSRRAGDQLGTLLAGAYTLSSNGEITLDAAKEWLAGKDWSEYTTAVTTESNERRMLAHLLQTRVKVVTASGNANRSYDVSLGELVAASADRGDIPYDLAEAELRRYGLRRHDDGIYVSTTHTALKRVFRDTPWSSNWRVPLTQIEGARKAPGNGVIRFGVGAVTPAIWVPLAAIDGGEA